jgi:hypothetical protein
MYMTKNSIFLFYYSATFVALLIGENDLEFKLSAGVKLKDNLLNGRLT